MTAIFGPPKAPFRVFRAAHFDTRAARPHSPRASTGRSGLLSREHRPARALSVQAPVAPGFFHASTGRPGLFRCKQCRNSNVGLCRNSPVLLICLPAARARRSRPLLSTSLLQTPTVTTSGVAQRAGAVRCPAEAPYGAKRCAGEENRAEPSGAVRGRVE